jgi:hypothetical protein
MNAHVPTPEGKPLHGKKQSPDDCKPYVLSILRIVCQRLKLIEAEVSNVGVALDRGLMSASQALLRVEQIAPGCYDQVALSVFDDEGGK